MARVPRSRATRNVLEAMVSGGEEFDLSALVRQAVKLMVEEALEAEVTDKLGREYYARGEARASAHRNGVRVARLKSAEGEIEYAVPQVRGWPGWQSEIKAALAGRTGELERLAVEMYARGLSVRDIEAAFTDSQGNCVLSKTAASRVTEALWAQYQEFSQRDSRARWTWRICSWMAWPNACTWGSRARRSSRRGASRGRGTRCCWA